MIDTLALKPTPRAHQDEVRGLYLLPGAHATPAWSSSSLAIHFGLDRDEASSFEDSLVETNRELARLARIAPGDRVLDAGCGIGGSSIWLCTERGAVTTGISLVAEQVVQAERSAREQGATGASFHVADYMASGLPNQSFDVVWNLESLCHCHDIEAYLPEAYRLLAAGGRFACMDVFRADGDADAAGLRAMAEGGGFGPLQRVEEVVRLLARAGFVDIEVLDLRTRALRSAERFRAMAHGLCRREQFCAALFGIYTAQPLRHAKASLACAQGVLSGALTYASIVARRPATA